MNISLPLLAVTLLAAPAAAAPTVKARTVPIRVQSLRVDVVDPSRLTTTLSLPSVSLDATLKETPVVVPAFNVPETIETGRIETARTIDVLRGVSLEKISADAAFDGGRALKRVTTGSESASWTPLKPSTRRKALGLTGAAALLSLPGAASDFAQDPATGYLIPLAVVLLAGLMFLVARGAADIGSARPLPWEAPYKAFVNDLESRPGVVEVRYENDLDWDLETLVVYYDDPAEMAKAELPQAFHYHDFHYKHVSVTKRLRPKRS